MKIRITFDLDDCARQWIAFHCGDAGKADYDRCKTWIESLVESTLEDIAVDYDAAHEDEDEE